MIHGHGNDIYRLKQPLIADFSSNVAASALHGQLHAHLIDQLPLLASYPEPDSRTLREVIAAHHAVHADQVLVTNGSVEAFYLIASAFQQANSLVLIPSFAEYEDACKVYRHSLRFEHHQRLKVASDLERFDLIWLARPNNPDGYVLDAHLLEHLIRKFPATVFVVDEAYLELSPQAESLLPMLENAHNLIVIRSMTKQFVLPGLRLGYLMCQTHLMERIKRFTQPWSVNALAQTAGQFIFHRYHQMLPDAERLCKTSAAMQITLSKEDRYIVTPSSCPFFLVQHRKHTAATIRERMLTEHGFLIRDASNFRGLNEHHFRISVRNDFHDDALMKALIQLV